MARRGRAASLPVFRICLWICPWILAGCAGIERAEQDHTQARLDEAIALYRTAASQVRLGDSQDKVVALLEPTQAGLYSDEIKGPDAIPTETETGEQSMVEVFFFRSSRHADEAPKDSAGMPLNDNFTPYVFTDGVLTGIGWPALLSMKIRKPAHQASPTGEKSKCPEVGPLAGCF